MAIACFQVAHLCSLDSIRAPLKTRSFNLIIILLFCKPLLSFAQRLLFMCHKMMKAIGRGGRNPHLNEILHRNMNQMHEVAEVGKTVGHPYHHFVGRKR